MSEMYLIKCVNALADKWKTHFGLFTQYAGYLTPELAISLLSVWRFYDNEDYNNLTAIEILKLLNERIAMLNENTQYQYVYFPENKDICTVVPKLIETLYDYDLSMANVPSEQWNDFLHYLDNKSKNKVRRKITSFSIDWYNCSCCTADSIVHEKTTLYLNESVIKIQSYNGYKDIVEEQTIPVSKGEIKGLFNYIQYVALDKLQQDYRVEVCDGSEWVLKLRYSDRTITAIQGTVEKPTICDEIEKRINKLLLEAESYADPILFGC